VRIRVKNQTADGDPLANVRNLGGVRIRSVKNAPHTLTVLVLVVGRAVY
jgi:hypothetical protein